MKNQEYLQQFLDQLVNKDKWTDFLRRFIDVLRINIFVVDYNGKLLIPPYRDSLDRGYGVEFLTASFSFDFSGQEYNMLEEFIQHGQYLEAKDSFDFHMFAIPVKADVEKTVAYLIVGPVILNKRWDNEDYMNMANRLHIEFDDLIDRILEIKVVSFVSMKAILDLLAKVVKDIVDLNVEMKRLHRKNYNKEVLSKEIAETAKDLYATIHLDELLITILDVALNLTQAESGSIMLLDERAGELVVKVSRGMPEEVSQGARNKIGEGISGIAARDNTSFVISGREGDPRIKYLLKRPSIKQSMVVPLSAQNRVFGVLNLHTEKAGGQISANVGNLEHLSKLISTAIHSI
ncbi:MAG TPA: GAF domain-containing protein [Candidatus Omnitrophota bacterium]|jgi:putative methionine-R-sulfoxide reductase with GAF domain|nr:GAF domain-containing protein [Candidatus Omnitrophota bacterium]